MGSGVRGQGQGRPYTQRKTSASSASPRLGVKNNNKDLCAFVPFASLCSRPYALFATLHVSPFTFAPRYLWTAAGSGCASFWSAGALVLSCGRLATMRGEASLADTTSAIQP